MTKSDSKKSTPALIVVGAIKGAHGVRGEVKLKSFTDDPDALFDYGPLLDAQGAPVLDVQSARPAKDHYIVLAHPHRQKEAWDALKGTLLHVPRSALPPTDAEEIYISDLIGLAVHDGAGETVGHVTSVQNYGAGDLLEISPKAAGKNVFVPFSKADVPDIDLEAAFLCVPKFEEWADAGDGDASPAG